MTPPSNSFETSVTGWATTAQSIAAISQVSGATDACAGSSYLQCKGSLRTQAWDGPATELLPYIVQGHKYAVTLAARFNPQDPPAAGATLIVSSALACIDASVSTAYGRVQENIGTSGWARFTGPLSTSLSGCSTLSSIRIYVESDANSVTKTIDVDDFQLIDITTSTGSGGATSAGGASAGGATASGGAATTSGGVSAAIGGASAITGGAPSTAAGGAAPSGGAPASGGAAASGGNSSASTSSDAGFDAA